MFIMQIKPRWKISSSSEGRPRGGLLWGAGGGGRGDRVPPRDTVTLLLGAIPAGWSCAQCRLQVRWSTRTFYLTLTKPAPCRGLGVPGPDP